MERYEFTRGLDHASIVAASERVAWTVDEVFGDRRFDGATGIVPRSWIETPDFLDEHEQRVLRQCSAFSYAHLLGNFEEFAPPHLFEDIAWHDDRARLRALIRFADEEAKHQQLLRRAELLLEESCGHALGRYFDDGKVRVTALTRTILAYPVLPRYLMVLALELGTQRHYIDSIGDRSGEPADALYVDVLKAHWVEEAQHVKIDLLEIADLAHASSSDALAAAFDDVPALGGLVDEAFAGQAAEEIAALQRITGRALSDRERILLQDTLHRSLRKIFAEAGLSHPRFVKLARELSPEGAAFGSTHTM